MKSLVVQIDYNFFFLSHAILFSLNELQFQRKNIYEKSFIMDQDKGQKMTTWSDFCHSMPFPHLFHHL